MNPAPEMPQRIGKGSHLLIDDFLIDPEGGRERAFAQPVRTTHQPEKLPEPILRKEGWHEQALFHLKVSTTRNSIAFACGT